MASPVFNPGSQSAVPKPFVVPRGPVQPGMGSGPEFARNIRVTPVRASGTNHLPNGEWTVSYPNIDVIPFPKLNYHTLIRMGQLVWCMNQRKDPVKSKLGDIILPIFCINDVLRRAKRSADVLIGPIRDQLRGVGAPGNPNLPAAADLGNEASRHQLVHLLAKTEHNWSYLFKPGTKLMSTNDGFSLMQYLCKEGIIRKYNLLGSCLVAPAVQYGPTDQPRTKGRLQMAVACEGVAYWDNLWPEAVAGSFLFVKLVRVMARTSGGRLEHDQFAMITYSNQHLKEIDPRHLEYFGTSGMTETGAAWYVAQVIDLLNPPPSKETVRMALGLIGTTEDADRESQRCGKIKVMAVSPERVC